MGARFKLREFSAQVTDHLYNFYLPFWCGPALDTVNGGWMAQLSNDLKADRSQPKGLIVNTRILWAFSAAHQARPDPIYAAMANRALEQVRDKFWDPRHGGAYWRLDDQGRVLDDAKKIYGQAFYIYAMVEHHRAFGSAPSLDRARQLFDLIERHAHDASQGGYLEVCRRDWSEADAGARLSDKDMGEKKSMNNHLHILEAYTDLFRAWPDRQVAARLRELIELFTTRIIDPRTRHLQHFFDANWNVRSDTYTFGHDIEASWLLCEAAEALRDPALLSRVQSLAVDMAEAAFNEGLSVNGALCYEGKGGKIIDPGCECWPQAEAIIGFLNAYQISNQERFLAAALRVWDYIQHHLVDREHGEWFWRINADGKPDLKLPKVSEWKGPYHVTRACLETARRLRQLEA
jgi:mannobiose 2-epimerase